MLSVQNYGSGSPLVLIGSLGSNTSMWLPQLDFFSQSRHVIAIDLPGHGQSASINDSLIDAFSVEILTTLDSLNIATFDVVGLSLGGAVSQHLALTSGRVNKLVLTSTAPKFGESDAWIQKATDVRAGGLDELSRTVIVRWFSPQWQEQHPASLDFWRRMISNTPAEGYARACEAISKFDSREQLGEIKVPTLVVAGTEDTSTAPEVVKSLAEGIPGARYHEFSPAAHLLNIERADEYNQLVAQFLES